MKTITAFTMTLAFAAISFAQTAAPATTKPAPAAKDNAMATTSVKKHSHKHAAKKVATPAVTPAAPAAGK